MKVDVSYIFQSDLVTECKPNFKIEDGKPTVLYGCNHVLALIAGLVGKYVQIQNFFRVKEKRERFLEVPESIYTLFHLTILVSFRRVEGKHIASLL